MMKSKELKTEINSMIKMLMSYGMNKHDAKICVLKILFHETDLFYETDLFDEI